MSGQTNNKTPEQGRGQIDTVIGQQILALAKEIGNTQYEVRRYPAAIAQWRKYTDAVKAGQSVGVVTPEAIVVAARVGRLLQVRLGGASRLEKHVWKKALADANLENAKEAHVVAILEETWLRYYTHLRRFFPPS